MKASHKQVIAQRRDRTIDLLRTGGGGVLVLVEWRWSVGGWKRWVGVSLWKLRLSCESPNPAYFEVNLRGSDPSLITPAGRPRMGRQIGGYTRSRQAPLRLDSLWELGRPDGLRGPLQTAGAPEGI